jgi:threonine synthase
LDAQYDEQRIRNTANLKHILSRPPTVWRWAEFLPVLDEKFHVNLGAGGSPLLPCPRLSEWVGAGSLYVKYEGMQPTHSLKDRSFAVAVAKATELGVSYGLTYSSGNAAAAFAAHANRAGLRGVVLVDSCANAAKLEMVRSYGCPVLLIDWEDFRDVETMMRQAWEILGVFTFVNFQNPWRHEAYKTYAFENWLDLGHRVPEHEIHPVGTGGGLFGSWKGYRDLAMMGWSERIPRLYGVQPSACPSVVTAFEHGAQEAISEGDPRATIAEAIANNVPFDAGRRPLRTVRDTGGQMLAVSDDEMTEGIRQLAREGICAEPAGASTVCAARQLARAGVIHSGEIVVCTVTASGVKQPGVGLPTTPPPRIRASFQELKRALQEVVS